MKKDNNRRSDSKRPGESKPYKSGGKFEGKKDSSFKKDYKKSKPYGEDKFEKKTDRSTDFSKSKEYPKPDFKKSYRSDQEGKSSFSKESYGKRTPKSDSTGGKFKSDFRDKDKFEKPFNKSGKSAPSDGKGLEPGEFKNVYRGRGKDEKPVFERVPKSDLPKDSGYTKKFKKPFSKNTPTEARPEYNFEKIEKDRGKKEENEIFRLNKYISNSGICSRREADQLIQKGEVMVNGEVITELGHKVMRTDKVVYKGKTINPEKPVYILMNKPKDFITTTDDPMERKTVMHLLENACKERVFPVGRLDRNTTGLLLFTNDGELAAKLSHPSNNIKKIYQVTLDKPITHNHEKDISEGLTLEDGPVRVDDIKVLSLDRTILGLEIHVGKNRIVRRIFAHLGYEVIGLDRVMYAGLDKKDLPRGKFRFLSEKEVVRLKYFL
jgi:23S rRNA pseudouridine2605 synthase